MKWKGRRQSKNVHEGDKMSVGQVLRKMGAAAVGGDGGIFSEGGLYDGSNINPDSAMGKQVASEKRAADERFRRKQRGNVSRESLRYASGGFVQNNMVPQKPTTKDYGGTSGKHSKVTGSHVDYGYAKGK